MSDPKVSDNPTSALPAAAPAAAASASPAVTPEKVTPVAATPAAVDPKAGEPAVVVPEKVVTPDPNAAATGVNEAEAKALADAAAAKAVTDKAAADAKAATDAEALAAAAPESYALDEKSLTPEVAQFLKDHGGLNPDLLPALTPALKEAKLTQSQFAAVANAFLGFQRDMPQRLLARDMEKVKADPTIGGLNYSRSMEEVSVALDAFADPDFKKWTVQAGIANKPEFVRVFQRIGRAMRAASDSPSSSSPDAAPAETVAQRMYGRKKT